MICPHCMIAFRVTASKYYLGGDSDGKWSVVYGTCPSCTRFVIYLQNSSVSAPEGGSVSDFFDDLLEPPQGGKVTNILVRPRGSQRPPCPTEVPKEIAEDYKEACLVLLDSPKASAALSRRCLQNLLRKAAKVKHGRLYDEIQEAMQELPSYLAEEIDDIRKFGNIAAHPTESRSTGEIIPVETGEAEAMLNILEGLFDFYYIQPARVKARRKVLQDKLK